MTLADFSEARKATPRPVDLGLGPRVEVRARRLEQRHPGTRHRLVLVDRVGEGVAELVIGERDGPTAVGRFPRTGLPDFSEEIGSGRIPRKGAESKATVAAERPRPARICDSRPPNEWPITAGFFFSPLDHLAEVVGDLADRLVGEDLGVLFRLGDRVRVIVFAISLPFVGRSATAVRI